MASIYARRALDADLSLSVAASPDERRRVEFDWEFAGDALAEALKFLPEDAGEVPSSAFWSESGRRLRTDNPELFTRDRVLRDPAYYRGTLEDFRTLHNPPLP